MAGPATTTACWRLLPRSTHGMRGNIIRQVGPVRLGPGAPWERSRSLRRSSGRLQRVAPGPCEIRRAPDHTTRGKGCVRCSPTGASLFRERPGARPLRDLGSLAYGPPSTYPADEERDLLLRGAGQPRPDEDLGMLSSMTRMGRLLPGAAAGAIDGSPQGGCGRLTGRHLSPMRRRCVQRRRRAGAGSVR